MNLTAGSALPLTIEATGTDGDMPPDLSVTPVTLVLDAVTRTVWRWRPPAPSSDFSYVGGVLRFTGLTSTFTATLRSGSFPLYVIHGESEDVQQNAGAITLLVSVPPLGPLPVTG